MNIPALILLAFAMSTDAFAASIGKGVKIKKPRLGYALKIGLTFGVVEAITPVIGWWIGSVASSYVEEWDHWVALVLLGGLGAHMIYESLNSDKEDEIKTKKQSFALVILTAFGTSIDAMAVGVSLAFIDVSIGIAATLIGIATFTMVTIGVMLGSALGSIIGKRAETLGGVILILVGVWIFLSHVL
ncbi:manganese efflux pump [Alteromonas pelagimontana]|uniref:Putative manganese efflux pump MntP n=1 Tax=Alteromonas pelagimontana TaxID=1858656 RepID=A0A6M4MC14_9ALTE|nr:manganese efflux pump MntP family protein [Alteromonas pelagimontana]QJR80721.1 manganese efflux pump [Alteromonas pelagimontana]